MVIWIVFTAVDFNVGTHAHYTPHQVVGIRAGSCGSFAGIDSAQLCFAVPICNGRPFSKFVEFTNCPEPTTELNQPAVAANC